METYLYLKRKRRNRRIITGSALLVSAVLLTVFCILKENSRIVTKIEVTPFYSYETVEYTKNYTAPIIIASVVLAFSLGLLIADFAATRIYYTVIDGEDIIVYNGTGHVKLLVNGNEADIMLFKGYMEAKLKNGVRITVSPQFYRSYHITFSDGRKALDL